MKKNVFLYLALLLAWAGFAHAQSPVVDELLTIEGINGSAIDLAWSPDGDRLAVAGGDGLLRLFDAETGELLQTLEGHGREVVSVEFFGDWLASSDLAGGIIIWDAESGETLQTLATDSDFVNAVRWSPDGAFLAVAVDRMVDPNALKPDDFQIQIWETESWTKVQQLKGHEFGTSDLQWSPDGSQLASAGIDGRLRIWETEGWTESILLGIVAPITGFTSLDWSPDGTQIVTAHFNNNLQIWDVASQSQKMVLQGHRDFVGHVVWFEGWIASASGSPISAESDNTIRLWDAGTGQMLLAVAAHENGVRVVAWSPDGKRLASGGDDSRVKIWSIQ